MLIMMFYPLSVRRCVCFFQDIKIFAAKQLPGFMTKKSLQSMMEIWTRVNSLYTSIGVNDGEPGRSMTSDQCKLLMSSPQYDCLFQKLIWETNTSAAAAINGIKNKIKLILCSKLLDQQSESHWKCTNLLPHFPINMPQHLTDWISKWWICDLEYLSFKSVPSSTTKLVLYNQITIGGKFYLLSEKCKRYEELHLVYSVSLNEFIGLAKCMGDSSTCTISNLCRPIKKAKETSVVKYLALLLSALLASLLTQSHGPPLQPKLCCCLDGSTI